MLSVLVLGMPTMLHCLCLPLALSYPRYSHASYLHTTLLPSFPASLYNIVPPGNYIPLPYLICHHTTWHCIACVFANLFIVSVPHGNVRPTRAGTWPSSLHYPLCLEQKLALNELPLNICWLLHFTLSSLYIFHQSWSSRLVLLHVFFVI